MKDSEKRIVRDSVLFELAVTGEGRVGLEDVARVFRRYADIGDIEKCLDQLVDEGLATKVQAPHGIDYIVESVARTMAESNEERLAELKATVASLTEDISRLQILADEEDDTVELLRPIWLKDWNDTPEELTGRIEGFVADALGGHIERLHSKIERLQDELSEANQEFEKRNRWKEESFAFVPAA